MKQNRVLLKEDQKQTAARVTESVWRRRTDLNVVERVELHEVMKPLEGLVGVFEVESRVGRGWIIKYVKVGKLNVLVCVSGNSFKKTEIRI